VFLTLQIGRGLAAIAVAAFHLSIALGDKSLGGGGTPPFFEFTGRGALGVDFFFVLSGFIILQAHRADIGHPEQVGRYLGRRFVRIYPIYWIYLAACIAGMAVIGSSHLQLSSVLEWLTPFSLIRLSTVELPLGQAWTLFHEVLFYALFALLIVNRNVGLVAFGVWLLVITFQYGEATATVKTIASTALSASNFNFFTGMLAFIVMGRLSKRSGLFGLLAGLVLFGATYHFDPGGQLSSYYGPAYAIAFGAILSCSATLECLGVVRPPAWLGLVGDASYSIYLLHEHLESYSLRVLLKAGLRSDHHPVLLFWVVLTVTLAGGCAAYLLVEKPLLRMLRSRIGRRSRVSAGQVAAAPANG